VRLDYIIFGFGIIWQQKKSTDDVRENKILNKAKRKVAEFQELLSTVSVLY
jgi:hypothetical protein